MRQIKDYLLLSLKGMAMGAADVVPGVSGGTIAFITGIYEELLDSIKSVDKEALTLLLKFDLKGFWTKINGNFLLFLFAGIVISLLSLAKVVSHLLLTYPIQVWSFFFGLIIISAVLVLRQVKAWGAASILAGLIGIGIAYFISVASPSETPTDLWFVFITGAVAICAMILPGISGAFILLIMGKYEFIVNALSERIYLVVGVFILGCLTGILSFSRVISWVLKKHYNVAVALLAGFMIGSLNKVWPWKEVLSYRIKSSGEKVPAIDQSVLPNTYLEVTGADPLIMQAIVFALIGFLGVFFLELWGRKLQQKNA